MSEQIYTSDSCLQSALNFPNKKEWRENARYYYHAAWKKAWLKDCCKHMTNPYAAPSKEECLISARKFNHINDWIKNCSREYSTAKKDKIFYKTCTSHMIPLGSIKRRLVYMFHAQKECYIGITWNLNERIEHHKNTKRYKDLLVKYGEVKVKILHNFCNYNLAITLETQFINSYRSKGWTILNKSNGGELGGCRTGFYISDKQICEQAKLYNTIKDWKNCKNSYLQTAYRRKIVDKYSSHMIRTFIRWTKESILQESLKYTSLQSWRETDSKSYGAAYKHNIIKDCIGHMNSIRKPHNYWNSYLICLNEALKYKNTREWHKQSAGSYSAALKYKWYQDISNKLKLKNEFFSETV